MKLSSFDKVSLIYTSAGSLRAVSSFTGLSRYMVTKILREGYNPPAASSQAFIDTAFQIHKELTRQQARADDLPFSNSVPIFIQRMPFKDGTPGDRVAALHTHYVPDRLRNLFLSDMQKSGKFVAASVQSIVNLVVYSKRADQNQARGKLPPRDAKRNLYHEQIKNQIRQQIVQGAIYTQYTPMARTIPVRYILDDIENKLQAKHDPAIGQPGTARATAVLLQVDTRNGKDAKFRDKHPRPTKPRKARRNSRRAGKRRARN